MATEASKEVARRPARSITKADELTTDDVIAQVVKVQAVMKAVMKEGVHYGVIPGTQKPTLLKPGAEKLLLTFRLAPQYEVLSSHEQDSFLSYTVRCTLTHITSGQTIASGIGTCNSRENKYRWRSTKRAEKPKQEEADLLKEQNKGYWRKLEGHWAWFDKVENDNPWELQNTLMKMAEKRALVAAVLNGTAASDIFAQDTEDLVDLVEVEIEEAEVVEPASSELIAQMREVTHEAAVIREDLWGENVLIANAVRVFKRPITKLEDLSEEEAVQIIEGARKWLKENVADGVLDPLPEEVAE
jgi:hypothetical protein